MALFQRVVSLLQGSESPVRNYLITHKLFILKSARLAQLQQNGKLATVRCEFPRTRSFLILLPPV